MTHLKTKGFKKGKYIPKNPEKYIGDVDNIIYRSSWELKVFAKMDLNPKVKRWGSEILEVKYIHPVSRKLKKYYPDLLVEIETADGKTEWHIIEIKPKKFTRKSRARSEKRRQQENIQFAINQTKWAAAKKLADAHGMKFTILTEDQIF